MTIRPHYLSIFMNNNAIEKLKNIVENKIVGVIARGKSLEILEQRITEFKDSDIVWASLNLFTPAEDFILSKISKKLSLVSDCSNLPKVEEFERECRRPRLEEYLNRREDNLLQISNTVINDLIITNNLDLFENNRKKIITIDDVFTGDGCPKELWDAPPNSITLLLASIIAGKAKKIIMFGYDGFNGNNNMALETYYKADLEKTERVIATGRVQVGSLVTDSRDFNKRWPTLYQMYKNTYGSNTEIVNCSPDSMFNVVRKINYEELKGEL